MAASIVHFAAGCERISRHKHGLALAGRLAALALGAALLGGTLSACHPPTVNQEQGADVGGPFHLLDQNGTPVTEAALKGKWSVVFFGYTFCPDVCPTTLTALGRTMDQLGPKAANVRVVFVTVDPARDTPDKMKTYLTSPVFPKGVLGLTGTPDQIAKVAKAYHVFYQKAGTGADYSMDHSTALYLMDPNGTFNRVMADGLTPEEMATQISDAMRGS